MSIRTIELLLAVNILISYQPVWASCASTMTAPIEQTQISPSPVEVIVRAQKPEIISEQDLATVKQWVLSTLNNIKGLKLPDRLVVTVISRGGRAFTEVNDIDNEIFVTLNPSTIVHEIGHVIFDINLAASTLPMARDLAEYSSKYAHELITYEHFREMLYGENRTFRGKAETHPHYSDYKKAEKALDKLKEKYLHVVGIAISPLWLRHAELFCDTLSYAMTADPLGNVDSLSEEDLKKYDVKARSAIEIARDFTKEKKIEDWENKHPYTEQHNYFGPTNSLVGKYMAGKSLPERMAFTTKLFKALVQSIEIGTQVITDGYYQHYPDIKTENKKLMGLIGARNCDMIKTLLSKFNIFRNNLVSCSQ